MGVTHTPAQKTNVAGSRCPSDNGPDLNPARRNFAMSNYRAIMGTISKDDPNHPYFIYNVDYGHYPPGVGTGLPGRPGTAGRGGILFQNSKITVTYIKNS